MTRLRAGLLCGSAWFLWTAMTPATAAAWHDSTCRDEVISSLPTGALRLLKTFPVHPRSRCISEGADGRFTLTLLEGKTAKVRWTLPAANSSALEGVPRVHDSGWVVFSDGQHLVVLDARTGRIEMKANLLDVKFPEGMKASLGYSSGGAFLVGTIREYFLEAGGHLFFVIRNKTLGFFVVDLQRRKLQFLASTEPRPDGLLQTLRTEEGQWVKSVLSPAVRIQDRKSNVEEMLADAVEIVRAAGLAGRERLVETVPDLHAAEAMVLDEEPKDCQFRSPDGYRIDCHALNWIRRAVQWALWRVGDSPSGRSALSLVGPDGKILRDPLASIRARRPDDVKIGMQPSDLLPIVGTPDVMNFCRFEPTVASDRGKRLVVRHFWDYFLDGQPRQALRLWWGEDGRIEALERRSPAWMLYESDHMQDDCLPAVPAP